MTMNLLVWNCRGLGNLRTGKELGKIIQAKDPAIVFLAKTWVDNARLEIVQRNIDFKHKWLVKKDEVGVLHYFGKPL